MEGSGHRLDRRLATGRRQGGGGLRSNTLAGWTGRCYHLRTEEVSDAETFVIYQALRALDQPQESRHRYTVFVDSTAAMDRVRGDALSPSQRFAVAAIEVYSRLRTQDNEVTVRRVSAYSWASGNEVADEYAKAASIGSAPGEEIPEGYCEETPSPMTRVATETRSRETAEWIAEHMRAGRRYRHPSGRGLRRTQLRHARKTLARRYYLLLVGYAAIRSHLLRI